MRVLTLNAGSSSLKFDLLETHPGDSQVLRIAGGAVDRIGPSATCSLVVGDHRVERATSVVNHAQAVLEAVRLLEELGLATGTEAIGHRVVHGGARFRGPTLMDATVVDEIEALSELAPLHNRAALAVIESARARFGAIPMVAVFDTAFFQGLPEVAAQYALPAELAGRLGIRRYGFHGLAHRYMVERYRALRPQVDQPRVISLQLGSGCSATASVDGRPRDTSMGFTPLEGLIMGTRSGDLDPSIPLYIAHRDGLSLEQVEAVLNTESGLLGLSGRSSDIRDLVAAETAGDERAGFAIDAFCYRVRKYIGAYLAVLGGADALVFGGGIGERSAELRGRIGAGMAWAGLTLDAAANDALSPGERRISTAGSSIEAWVVPVDEATVIALDVVACLAGDTGARNR